MIYGHPLFCHYDRKAPALMPVAGSPMAGAASAHMMAPAAAVPAAAAA